MHHFFSKIIKQQNCFQHNFLDQEIIILEWILTDHMTLKTAVMMLKFRLYITEINDNIKYIEIENSYFKR